MTLPFPSSSTTFDGAYAAAVDAEIVHPLTDEAWGVRRFFVRDPDANVLDILYHV